MAPDRNASSREQTMNKTQQEDEEDEQIDEMNDDDDAGAVVVDVDGRNSRDGLLCTLLRLNVESGPLFVLRKRLVKSYLCRNQNYLGITQAEYERGFQRHGVLSDAEHAMARAEGGLPLRALDRRGAAYAMVLVRLAKACRLRTGWGAFLRGAGVRQDDCDAHVGDVVEVWAFRTTSPAWPGNGLGLVLLHYTKEEDDAIVTASSLLEGEERDEEEEDGNGITTSSDSDQGGQCFQEDHQDEDCEKNCSPLALGQCQDGNCSPTLDNEVVHAAAILISMTKQK